ncbi:NAD(P)H-dependent oxidoreductase subunit E [Myxococcota bacterium]|nr:NAD(P)H-dependent oxidoreductase subunit E [Myxococcota bacterium]MCZ7619214.1 NAD(P)H-dependent oxidoreductase subunit E [Myxococcota bacterium]
MTQTVAGRPESSRETEGPAARRVQEDPRWKPVAATLRRQGHRPDALIEGMHAAQQAFGWLDPAVLRALAEALDVPLAKVFGVATFYHLFTTRPLGTHGCIVCLGTACHLKGGPEILAALTRAHPVEPGQTSPGAEMTLTVARCIGACTLAPLVVLDGEIAGPVTVEEVLERVERWFGPASGETTR